jgi:hypothetical protein
VKDGKIERHNRKSGKEMKIQIKEDDMSGSCSTHGNMRNIYKILVEKPKGKRPLGRPKHKWEIILEWILKE